MPGGPAINGAGPPLGVLHDMRRHPVSAQVRHAVPGANRPGPGTVLEPPAFVFSKSLCPIIRHTQGQDWLTKGLSINPDEVRSRSDLMI